MDLIKEEPSMTAEELQIKLEEGNINIHLSFNIKLSRALRKMAKKTGNTDFNQMVGDIVVEKLTANGLFTSM